MLRNAAGIALAGFCLVWVNLIAGHGFRRFDLTQSGQHRLAASTRERLSTLGIDAQLTLIGGTEQEAFASARLATQELLTRFAAATPRIKTELLDVDRQGSRIELLARRYALDRQELRRGVVIVAGPKSHRVVALRSMSVYSPAAGGGHRLLAYSGEGALLGALAAVATHKRPRVCFSQGHGEAAIDSYEEGGIGVLADELRREGYRVSSVASGEFDKRLRSCATLVILGPTREWGGTDLEQIEAYLKGSGRLFVLLGPVLDRGLRRYGVVGIERLLESHGITFAQNVVVDPIGVLGEPRFLTWATHQGYSEHPAVRALRNKTSVWPLSREVRPSGRGGSFAPLVSCSDRGWGETDLSELAAAKVQFDAGSDSRGPVVVAAAAVSGGSKIVAFGCERGMLNRRFRGPMIRDFNRDLFLNGVAWLSDQAQLSGLAPKAPAFVQLRLDSGQLAATALLCIVALPLLAASMGLIVWWRRRR